MSHAGRYLGVDLGAKRIGFAISSPEGIVSALKVLPASAGVDENARGILDVVDEYGADAIVLGLPLNMDGTEGPQARLSRVLAVAIQKIRAELPIYLYDERLTSNAADRELAARELTRRQKKSRQDAVAAKVLLESFVLSDARPEPF